MFIYYLQWEENYSSVKLGFTWNNKLYKLLYSMFDNVVQVTVICCKYQQPINCSKLESYELEEVIFF